MFVGGNKMKPFKLLSSWGFVLFLMGCHLGGQITESPLPAPPPAGKVDSPTVALPAASPYYSQASSLSLSGMCETGVTVLMTGDDVQETLCVNSQYAMQVSKTTDGVYSFNLAQRTVDQKVSLPTVFVWVRKTSVPPPSLSNPSTSVFSSAKDTLTLEGHCESGSLIALSGDGIGYATCLNSAFSITVPKSLDGDYVIGVNQTDLAGNVASTSITWKKHALTLTPGNALVVVNTSFNFTINGGSENYTVTLFQNNSGGTLNTTTNTYTTGTLANAVDTIRVTDSLGSVLDFSMTTVPGTPDHLTLISSDNPSANQPGNLATDPVVVKLVDLYGNGISSYPLIFKVVSGDSKIIGNALQATDLNGLAQVSIRHGYHALLSILSIGPSAGVLPDLASSGTATVPVSISTETNNNSQVGAFYSTGSNPAMITSSDFNKDGEKRSRCH